MTELKTTKKLNYLVKEVGYFSIHLCTAAMTIDHVVENDSQKVT